MTHPAGFAVTDFTKTPEAIVVDLINYANDTASVITTDTVAFGNPHVITGGQNTRLRVTAGENSAYTGYVDVTYNRIDLATVPGVRSTIMNIAPGDVKISDIIPEINRAYNINLTYHDFVDGNLPVFDVNSPSTLPFTLVAGANSLVFIGSVQLQIQRGLVPLSTVILVTMLNGLVYDQP